MLIMFCENLNQIGVNPSVLWLTIQETELILCYFEDNYEIKYIKYIYILT